MHSPSGYLVKYIIAKYTDKSIKNDLPQLPPEQITSHYTQQVLWYTDHQQVKYTTYNTLLHRVYFLYPSEGSAYYVVRDTTKWKMQV